MRRRFLSLLLFGVGVILPSLLSPSTAFGHRATSTRSRVTVQPSGEIAYRLEVPVTDLSEALEFPQHRAATAREVRAGEDQLFRYFLARLHLESGGVVCPTERRGVDVLEDTALHAELRFVARCPGAVQMLAIDYQIFFDLDPGHVGVLELTCGGRKVRAELTSEARRQEFQCGEPAPPPRVEGGCRRGGVAAGAGGVALLVAILVVVARRRRARRAG